MPCDRRLRRAGQTSGADFGTLTRWRALPTLLCFALCVHCIPSPCVVVAGCTHSTKSAPVVALRFVASSVRRGAIRGREDMQLLIRSSCRALLMVISADRFLESRFRASPATLWRSLCDKQRRFDDQAARTLHLRTKKADVQHQTCRYETVFHSVLRLRWEHPLSFCVTSALPYCCLTLSVAITCHRVLRRVMAEYELTLCLPCGTASSVGAMWRSVETMLQTTRPSFSP